MSKSLFNVTTINGSTATQKNIIAGPTDTESALQVAVDAAVSAAGAGSSLQNAFQQGNAPIGVTTATAVSPATDGTPKSVWSLQTPSGPVLVLSWPQTNAGVTVSAADRALQAVSGATVISFSGNVDIEV
jgi:hypothetical protein